MTANDFESRLGVIANKDIATLVRKDAEYGSSWKRRGGIGAYHQALCRKWDRIEQQVGKYGDNIFKAIVEDTRPEGIMDDIQDLRRYLLLIEEHCSGTITKESDTKSDGQDNPRGADKEPVSIKDIFFVPYGGGLIGNGYRNSVLAGIAEAMVAKGSTSTIIIYERLYEINSEFCRPPLSDAEVMNIASNAIRVIDQTGQDNPRGFDPKEDV